MVKLSIIIPAYNAEPYVYMLLKVLDAQITNEVEVILIDDGSKKPVKTDYKWLKVVRQKNRGISKTRNRGLEMARGELIAFIDADDLVAENYVEYILSRIDEEWDYLDLSWKSLEDNHFYFKLKSDKDALANPSASTRVFRRSFIGDNRFPEKKDACEDEHFTRHLGLKKAKHICATDFMYFYRTSTPDSNSKRFLRGECNTKRIVYFFKEITSEMSYLIDEIRKEDEINEVIVMTNNNALPELEKYAQVMAPTTLNVYEKRGEETKLLTLIPRTENTQVVLYLSQSHIVGGIETFLVSFCNQMKSYYDIIVVYDSMASNLLYKLSSCVKVIKNDYKNTISCDSLIMVRILDNIPPNIKYKKCIRMAHCIKQEPSWIIKKDCDFVVNVSQASKDSFGDEAAGSTVIHNLTYSEENERCLLLVSAIRVGAVDKQGNDYRCVQFAQKLNALKIPFIWVYFGDKPMPKTPDNMLYGGLKENMRPYIRRADYLVQLSGSEAFSYSLLESLEEHTPVIVTPLEQNKDMKIVDGENAYVFPFEVSEWTDDMIKRIVQIPQFDYKHDNEAIVKQWRTLLGKSKPKGNYKPISQVEVIVSQEYFDLQLKETLKPKDKKIMPLQRAIELKDKGLVEITGGF